MYTYSFILAGLLIALFHIIDLWYKRNLVAKVFFSFIGAFIIVQALVHSFNLSNINEQVVLESAVLGAIIGGIITLVVMIYNTNELTKRYDKQISVQTRPYVYIYSIDTISYNYISCDIDGKVIKVRANYSVWYENISNFPALSFGIVEEREGKKVLHDFRTLRQAECFSYIESSVLDLSCNKKNDGFYTIQSIEVGYISIDNLLYTQIFELSYSERPRNFSKDGKRVLEIGIRRVYSPVQKGYKIGCENKGYGGIVIR